MSDLKTQPTARWNKLYNRDLWILLRIRLFATTEFVTGVRKIVVVSISWPSSCLLRGPKSNAEELAVIVNITSSKAKKSYS